ncbi:hypothetical protein GCM10011390_10710 [Aureimonas endophytica]|uniref:Uncharacterized protein n=1 Tax=Aureimonas endophytica TaxID=2027858 RepID=A0A916ZF64_9HYPH|nr:hypothetical protein [Aureimonas endophytica]GGD93834.1 hypothetical protein GCM10011390_10710 [Aureimonas endophytica]
MTVGGTVDADKAKAGKPRRTLSQRLLRALTGEVLGLERSIAKARGEGTEAARVGAETAGGAKARVEAIGALTRTLYKLLELTRAEAAAVAGEAADEAEAERLRAELMKRLRALDARRLGGRRLFGNAETTASLA